MSTVERAIKLTEYFKESALNVQNILNENALNSQQQAIANLLPPAFTTAQAIQIAEQNGMKERTFQRFLNDNIGTLFRKEKHGEYSAILQQMIRKNPVLKTLIDTFDLKLVSVQQDTPLPKVPPPRKRGFRL